MNKLIKTYSKTMKLAFTILLIFISQISFASKNDSLIVEISSESELTVQNVKQALIEQGVKHADIVLRQAILETGWFKCTSCSLSRNNIFGFWYKKKYISFDHWTDCVSYYKRWQERHYDGGDYYDFLKRVGYATSKTYIQKLKSIRDI